MDRQRVERLARVRRMAIRARTYCIVGWVGSWVTAANLVWMAGWRIISFGQVLRPGFYLLAAGGLIWLGVVLWKKGRALGREVNAPEPGPAVEEKPDFSTLGDGSQIVRDLENIE